MDGWMDHEKIKDKTKRQTNNLYTLIVPGCKAGVFGEQDVHLIELDNANQNDEKKQSNKQTILAHIDSSILQSSAW